MKLFRVLQIHFEDVNLRTIRMVCYGFREPVAVFYPLEAACRDRFTHCPPIKVNCVEVKNVTRWLRRLLAFYSGVVGPSVTF